VLSDRFQLPEYESRLNGYPRTVRQKEFDFGVYRMALADRPTSAFSLDIGRLDDLNVVRFHAKEQFGDTPFRWSRRTSYIALPPLAQASTLTLWLSDGGRPKTVDPARVDVSINGTAIGHAMVTSEFEAYTFAIPALARPATTSSDQAALVQVATNTWQPRRTLGTSDDRELGVMVRRIEIK
jgi:hypothetical protein